MTTLDAVREKIRKNMPDAPFQLVWKRVPNTTDCIVSECGRFYVSKVTVDGKPYFEAWFKPHKDAIATGLAYRLATGAEAKAIASSHAATLKP